MTWNPIRGANTAVTRQTGMPSLVVSVAAATLLPAGDGGHVSGGQAVAGGVWCHDQRRLRHGGARQDKGKETHPAGRQRQDVIGCTSASGGRMAIAVGGRSRRAAGRASAKPPGCALIERARAGPVEKAPMSGYGWRPKPGQGRQSVAVAPDPERTKAGAGAPPALINACRAGLLRDAVLWWRTAGCGPTGPGQQTRGRGRNPQRQVPGKARRFPRAAAGPILQRPGR